MQKKLWLEKQKELKIWGKKGAQLDLKKVLDMTNWFSGFWVHWGKLAEANLLQQTQNEYLLCTLKVALCIFFFWDIFFDQCQNFAFLWILILKF